MFWLNFLNILVFWIGWFYIYDVVMVSVLFLIFWGCRYLVVNIFRIMYIFGVGGMCVLFSDIYRSNVFFNLIKFIMEFYFIMIIFYIDFYSIMFILLGILLVFILCCIIIIVREVYIIYKWSFRIRVFF